MTTPSVSARTSAAVMTVVEVPRWSHRAGRARRAPGWLRPGRHVEPAAGRRRGPPTRPHGRGRRSPGHGRDGPPAARPAPAGTRLELSFAGVDHAVGSLLGLGTRVEVRVPEPVRAALRAAALEVAALYAVSER